MHAFSSWKNPQPLPHHQRPLLPNTCLNWTDLDTGLLIILSGGSQAITCRNIGHTTPLCPTVLFQRPPSGASSLLHLQTHSLYLATMFSTTILVYAPTFLYIAVAKFSSHVRLPPMQNHPRSLHGRTNKSCIQTSDFCRLCYAGWLS